jgi:hypothetical protein
MIISSNKEPDLKAFKALVNDATSRLNADSAVREAYYLKRNAQLLEDDVCSALKAAAVCTPFANTIQKVSGQRFPDIVAARYYGVEVKSSKDESWTSLGGSVNESTRVRDVERIFLTFGKLCSPIEFCSRAYEECLSEVVVTHYPRYKVDMRLLQGETIFDKMHTTYDALRSSEAPVAKIISYYKSQLKQGESLWWAGDSPEEASPFKLRIWGTLSQQEKRELTVCAYALFPELLSSSASKYSRASMWLAAQHGVVSTSMRDSFSAGGRASIVTDSGTFENLPRVFANINELSSLIALKILQTDKAVLCETWGVNKI